MNIDDLNIFDTLSPEEQDRIVKLNLMLEQVKYYKTLNYIYQKSGVYNNMVNDQIDFDEDHKILTFYNEDGIIEWRGEPALA